MPDKYYARYTSEQCLESILSIGQGEPISAEKYDKAVPRGFSPTSRSIIERFGSWKRALNLAGFLPETRYCLNCGKKFEVFQRNKDQRFCSDICRSRYYHRNFPDKVKERLRESFYKRRKTVRYRPKFEITTASGKGQKGEKDFIRLRGRYLIVNNREDIIYHNRVDFLDKYFGWVEVSSSGLLQHYKKKGRKKYLRKYWNFNLWKRTKVDHYYLVGFDSNYEESLIRLLIPTRDLDETKKAIYFPYSRESKWNRYVVNESELFDKVNYE
jgi:hypothetical protein